MRLTSQEQMQRIRTRAAFTLVEMLISVALVLMLMTMFATIFQITTGSMMTQRGISENDQRARILSTVVRKDLQHRTFRYPLAFFPGENSGTSPTSFSNRAGYLYISTNDPNTGLDDLIQFTVSAHILSEDTDGTHYFGRAASLWDPSANGVANPPYSGSSDPRRGSLYTHINQPETDDGTFSPNFTGSSPFAEISYFIRRGNLFRRVSLIREPLNVAGKELGPQPTTAFGNDYFADFGPVFPVSELETRNDFFLHFDYSAVRIGGVPVFLGSDSLSNEETTAGNVFANPAMRFGFNPITGRSREHTVVPAVGPPIFLGRFTHGETSALNFNSPQTTCRIEQNPHVPDAPDDPNDGDNATVLGNGNPFDIVNTPLTLNAGNGVVSGFDGEHTSTGIEGRGGERRVEDLLLANVHEMKIELWDERLQRFVTPGHSSENLATSEFGDYHSSRCHNLVNGPISGLNPGALFDTWHPSDSRFDSNNDGVIDGLDQTTLGEQSPPYITYSFYPPRFPSGPSPAAMPDPAIENPLNRGFWQLSTSYGVGDVVFVPWNDAPPFDGVFQYSEIEEPKFQTAYRCVVAGTSNVSQPQWQRLPGRRTSEAPPSTVVWESFDNRRPLQSIRLTFRFHDKTSDSMRQLSLVVPMTETAK